MPVYQNTHDDVLNALVELVKEFDRYDEVMSKIGRGHEDYGGQREAARHAIANAKQGHTITIEVEGGCVQEVYGLPDGWLCKIDDRDTCEDEDDESEHVCDDDCRSNGCPVVRNGGQLPGEDEDAEGGAA